MTQRTIFIVTVLFCNLTVSSALAAATQPSAIAGSVEAEGNSSPADATVGRYTITPYRDTVVLLNTATGATWILKSDSDSDSVSWLAIQRGVTIPAAPPSAAEAGTVGRVIMEHVPELGVIILKGSRGDVESAKEAIERVSKLRRLPQEE
jgi:hypothetical protein